MNSQISPQYCGSATCAEIEALLTSACHDLGKRPGQPVMVSVDGKLCSCPCPSGALGAGVLAAPDNALIPIALACSQPVLAVDRTGGSQTVSLDFVRQRRADRHDNMICLRYRASGLDVTQVLPMDALLMQYDGGMVAASRVALTDELVDVNGNSVPVLGAVWGAYEGVYFDIATDLSPQGPDLSGRFLVRDGIVVGDFALQIHRVVSGGFGTPPKTRALVGSDDWDRINGADGQGVSAVAPMDLPNGTFFPAAFATTDIPVNAVAARGTRHARVGGSVATIEDQSSLHRVEHLIAHVFRGWYPAVNFILDWYSHDEDVYLWRDDAECNVLITGGLARNDEAAVPALVHALIEDRSSC